MNVDAIFSAGISIFSNFTLSSDVFHLISNVMFSDIYTLVCFDPIIAAVKHYATVRSVTKFYKI